MYGYAELLQDIDAVSGKAHVHSIGKSGGGREIWCAHIGSKKGMQLVITGAIHAREHITAKLVAAQMRYAADRKVKSGGMYFIPMVNPDGVELCINGQHSVKDPWYREYALLLNGNDEDFSLWKANLFGVDLNVNFPARYGTGKQNVRQPGAANYIGSAALSEPESMALGEFIKKVCPHSVLCYHCKGEVIFWRFYQQQNLLRDSIIAQKLSRRTGYPLCGEEGSAGGVKDWCIQELKIPAFTVEVGSDDYAHPFPYQQFTVIWQQNYDLPFVLMSALLSL